MSTINEKIGARVKAARKAKGLTQEEFAQKLGLTQGQVSRHEKGATELSVAQLEKISGLLDVDLPYFMNLEGSERQSLSVDALEIALLWERLDSEKKAAAKVMLKGLLSENN